MTLKLHLEAQNSKQRDAFRCILSVSNLKILEIIRLYNIMKRVHWYKGPLIFLNLFIF